MLKFALIASGLFEWVHGPYVYTALDFFHMAMRTFMGTLLAWMALELLRTIYEIYQSHRVPDGPYVVEVLEKQP